MSRDALVVGINTYSKLPHLTAPAVDAEAIGQRLERNGGFQVRRLPEFASISELRVAAQVQVSLRQLRQALIELFKPESRQAPDTALFYFSGHGVRVTQGVQEGFLATSDINPDVDFNGLSLRWLRQLLEESTIPQQIIWLDCCHSGSFIDVTEADPGEKGKGRDRCFIAASRDFESAWQDISSPYSIFTKELLEGLNPNRCPERWVTNYNLIDFLDQRVQKATQRFVFTNAGGPINLTRLKFGDEIENAISFEPGICPYRGLQYFDCNDEDSKYFYGRAVLIDHLLDRVRRNNFLVITGASGSGKSSVLRAGLLYQLKRGQRISGSHRWQFHIMVPGADPLQNLALALLDPKLSGIDRAVQLAQIEGLLIQDVQGLRHLIKASIADRVILIVDQFEEVFTLCENLPQREQFLQCLMAALGDTTQLCLILAIRADFFGKFLEHDYNGLSKRIERNLVTITPMTRDELREVITKPAEQINLSVEPELIEQMIIDVSGSPGSLPLLQYTLTELWKQQTDGWLRLNRYSQLGGISATLQKRATEVYESLLEDQRNTAQYIFLALVRPGEGTEDTRRRVLLSELINNKHTDLLISTVVQHLANEKLIVTSEMVAEDSKFQRVAIIDVAHEALIRNWDKLQKWITLDREFRLWQERLRTAIQQWEKTGKDEGALLRGTMLVEAQEKLCDRQEDLSQREQIFIRASLELRDKERKQREQGYRFIILGLTGFSTVILSLAGIAVWQWQQAEIAQVNTLTKSSELLLASNQSFDALITSLKAEKRVRQIFWIDQRIRNKITDLLQQSIYTIKERNRLEGNNGFIRSIMFSPDSKTIVSASVDDSIRLWNAITGQLIYTFSGHNGIISSVVFSPDGKTLASGSYDGTVKLWNVTTGQLIYTFSYSGAVHNIVFSPDGRTLASGSDNGTIKLWDVTSKQLIYTFSGHSGAVHHIAFSPNGKILVSGDIDGTIKLWDATTGQLMHSLRGHTDAINSILLSPDGKTLASGSTDRTVKLWHIPTGQLIRSLPGHTDVVARVAFSPNGKILASGSEGHTIKLWNVANGQLVYTFSGHTDSISNIMFSPDGRTLASGSDDHTVRLWDVTNGQPIKALLGHTDAVNSVAFSPDGKTLASGSADSTVKLWTLNTNQRLNVLSGHSDAIWSIMFSPDGKTLASGSADRTVKLWDVKTGYPIHTFLGHKKFVLSIMFSPDGKTLASGSADATVKLWDVITGRLIYTFSGHRMTVNNVVFSPNEKKLASGSFDGTIKLWNVTTGQLIYTFSGHQGAINSVAFSPDGKKLASGSFDGTIKLWNVTTGQLIYTFSGHQGAINSVAFSPDGKKLASGSSDHTIRLWDTATGQFIYSLLGHSNTIYSVVFSPDGKKLASGSSDYTAKLWDIKSGQLIHSLYGHSNTIYKVTFNPDGRTLASASVDRTVKLWNTRTGQLIYSLYGHNDAIYRVVFSPDGKTLASASVDHTSILWKVDLDLDVNALVKRGCSWVHYYLQNNPNVADSDRNICNGIETR